MRDRYSVCRFRSLSTSRHLTERGSFRLQTRTLLFEQSISQSVRSPVGLDRCLDRMLTVTVVCTGRAIRNSQDWAAIILLDARYTQQSKKSQLPKWLGSNVQSPATFGGLLQGLVAFNKARRKV